MQFVSVFDKILLRHNFILADCKPTRFYQFGKNARLCFACLQLSIEVVSQQLEPRVFRAQLRLRTFYMLEGDNMKKRIISFLLTVCIFCTLVTGIVPIANASNAYVINGVTVHTTTLHPRPMNAGLMPTMFTIKYGGRIFLHYLLVVTIT